jgi:hypothetical protein
LATAFSLPSDPLTAATIGALDWCGRGHEFILHWQHCTRVRGVAFSRYQLLRQVGRNGHTALWLRLEDDGATVVSNQGGTLRRGSGPMSWCGCAVRNSPHARRRDSIVMTSGSSMNSARRSFARTAFRTRPTGRLSRSLGVLGYYTLVALTLDAFEIEAPAIAVAPLQPLPPSWQHENGSSATRSAARQP